MRPGACAPCARHRRIGSAAWSRLRGMPPTSGPDGHAPRDAAVVRFRRWGSTNGGRHATGTPLARMTPAQRWASAAAARKGLTARKALTRYQRGKSPRSSGRLHAGVGPCAGWKMVLVGAVRCGSLQVKDEPEPVVGVCERGCRYLSDRFVKIRLIKRDDLRDVDD